MAVATGNVPLLPHMNFNFRRIRIGLIGDNAPSKQICFSPAISRSKKPLKRSGGLAMMVMNLASPLERFEGFRLAHCQEKHIRRRHWRLTMAGLTDNNQPKAAEEEMARTTTTTGKDGNNNRQGRRRWQGRQQ